MSTFQSPHSSRQRRAQQPTRVDDATTSEDEQVHYHHAPVLPPEEAHRVLRGSETSELKSAAGAPPFAPAPAPASPCTKVGRDGTRATHGHARRYTTASASDSADSGVVLRSSDRAGQRSLRGSQPGSEQASGSSGVSPVKSCGTPRCPAAPGHGAGPAAPHRSSLVDDAEGDGVVFELYRPRELHRAETGASRESPLPPAVLALRLPAKGMPGRASDTSAGGSREQAGVGRYALLSHSSRLEEMRRLPPRASSAGGEFSGEAASGTGGVATQDDIVRHSTAESFSADGTGVLLNGTSQPQLMESSMNSQFFLKSKQRRHSGHRTASVSRGVNRHDSVNGPHPSPHISADTAAPARLSCSGPHLLSSDQIVVTAHPRGHAVSRQNGPPPQRSGEVAALPASSGDGAAVVQMSSLSQSSGFDLVRAPITGLRAKVLGNTAVDEEEAAEDPELRALQAEQLRNFYSKVVKQHRGGGGAQTAAQTVPSPAVPAPAESPVGPSLTPPSPAAGDAPATHDPALKSAWKSEADDPDVAARRGLKKLKKVRFNMEGVEHRRAEPGATPLPHHGTPQPANALTHRALSPLRLQDTQPVQDGGVGASGGEAAEESCDHVNWQSPPPPTSLRLALRAGVAQPALSSVASMTASDVLVGSSDEAAHALAVQPITPMRVPASPSASYTPRSEAEEVDDEVDDDASEQSLATTLTPARAAKPGLCAPPPLRPSAVNAPVPLPQPPQAQTPCSAAPSPSAAVTGPRKRGSTLGTPHKRGAKKHRKAAVALVAGAGDPIVVARASGSSSVQGARVSDAASIPSAVLASAEAPLSSEAGSEPGKGRKLTRPAPPHLQSLSSPRVEGQSPSPMWSTEGLDAPHHRIAVPRSGHQAASPTSHFCVPASLRSMQVVPDTSTPATRTPMSPSSAPVVSAFADVAPSLRAKERRERPEKRATVRVLQPLPEVPSTPMKPDLPRRPPTQRSGSVLSEEVVVPMAAVDVKARAHSARLDDTPVLPPPFVPRLTDLHDSASSLGVQSLPPSCVLALHDRRLSESSHSRASLSHGETEAPAGPPASRSPLQVLPNLLASSSTRKS